MKTNWIKRGTPIVALFIMIAIGVMSCSTDPVSSNNSESAALTMQANGTENENHETDNLLTMSGILRQDPSGECWYLEVTPSEIYELKTRLRMRGGAEGSYADVSGWMNEEIPPYCSNFNVFKVTKIVFETEQEM